MYSTVITNHPTVIRHQSPQPTGVGVHFAAAAGFAADSAEALKAAIPHGAYSIPVQVNTSADSLKEGYEIPNFIHTGERKIQESEANMNVSNMDPAAFLKNSMEKDIGEFLAQFDNTKDKSERIATCKILFFLLF